MKLAVTFLHSPALCSAISQTPRTMVASSNKKKKYNSESLPECRCALLSLKSKDWPQQWCKDSHRPSGTEFPPCLRSCLWDSWMKYRRAAGTWGQLGHLGCASLHLCADGVALWGLCTHQRRFKAKMWSSLDESASLGLMVRVFARRHWTADTRWVLSCSSKPAGSNISFS